MHGGGGINRKDGDRMTDAWLPLEILKKEKLGNVSLRGMSSQQCFRERSMYLAGVWTVKLIPECFQYLAIGSVALRIYRTPGNGPDSLKKALTI